MNNLRLSELNLEELQVLLKRVQSEINNKKIKCVKNTSLMNQIFMINLDMPFLGIKHI